MPAFFYATSVKAPTGAIVRYDTDGISGTPVPVVDGNGNPPSVSTNYGTIASAVRASNSDGSLPVLYGDASTVTARVVNYAGQVQSGSVVTITGQPLPSNQLPSGGGGGGPAVDSTARTAAAAAQTTANAAKPQLTVDHTARAGAFTAVPWTLYDGVDISAGSFTITLPAASSRWELVVKVKVATSPSSPTTAVTVAPSGSDTLNGGAAGIPLRYVNQTKTYISDGSGAITIGPGDFDSTVTAAQIAAQVSAEATRANGAYLAQTKAAVIATGLTASDIGASPAGAYVKPAGGIPNSDLATPGGGGSGRPVPAATSTAYAATVTPNVTTTDVLTIGALTGNITIANPAGSPSDGQKLELRMAQDATGGRTITFGSQYVFGSDLPAAQLPQTPNTVWHLVFEWVASASVWRAIGLVRF